MEPRCQNCGEPAVQMQADWLVCARCAARFDEYDRNRAAADAGLFQWNTSQHDPFWRGWLTSWQLLATLRASAPRVGKHLARVADGDVFECLRGVYDCWLQVWLSNTEVLVAYPPTGELFGMPDHLEGLHQFAAWADDLRTAPSLVLGQARERCSYGAVVASVGGPPVVKWAQRGDWAAMAHTWYTEQNPTSPTWP